MTSTKSLILSSKLRLVSKRRKVQFRAFSHHRTSRLRSQHYHHAGLLTWKEAERHSAISETTLSEPSADPTTGSRCHNATSGSHIRRLSGSSVMF